MLCAYQGLSFKILCIYLQARKAISYNQTKRKIKFCMAKPNKCYFCGSGENSFDTVEHILPESLGNKELILKKGIVCDKCNNYFARKIEKPFMDMEPIMLQRFLNQAENKKGRVPPSDFLIAGEVCKVDIICGRLCIGVSPRVLSLMASGQVTWGFGRAPMSIDLQNNQIVSRFLGKVGLEYLFSLLVEKKILFSLSNVERCKNYVRQGSKSLIWPYSLVEEKVSILFNPLSYFSLQILLKEDKDLIFRLRLFNISYTINLSEQRPVTTTEGYKNIASYSSAVNEKAALAALNGLSSGIALK